MSLFVPPVVRATDANNAVLSGAKWYFYVTGTTTPASVYTTSARTVAHPNPVVADSGGSFPPIYLDPAVTYRAVLKTAAGVAVPNGDIDPYSTDSDLRADLAAPTGYTLVGGLAMPLSVTHPTFGAKGDGIRNQTGSTTASSTAFTDASGTFTQADVGKAILIFGGSGVQSNLLTTIAAVGSSTSITLAATPSVTMTGNVIYCYGTDDTAAFVAHAAAYKASGIPAIIPDTGAIYLVRADQINYAPPTRNNALYIEPPAFLADPTAQIMALTGGTYLIKLGTLASDYSGFMRGGDFSLPIIDGNNLTFTKAPLYLPFFMDIDARGTVKNAKRCVWLGDASAPAASAGIKGDINCTRDFAMFARTVQSITNASNPTVTFATPHGLWPSSGNQVVCIDITGTLGSWSALNAKSVDCTVLSATQIQLKNVDSTSWGALPGTSTAYLNSGSMRIAKAISGVTNANPCVITTAVPHLLTSGDTVDVAEIGGMDPSIDSGRTGIQGQYVATVLSATTFSIPVDTTSTTNYGSYFSSLGAGQVMPWVAPANCDIGVYLDNCTDADLFNCYFKHIRIPIYANPATSGYDGKYTDIHFYNFPEAGEMLTPIYAGGDNDMDGCQVDGPFRYAGWFSGPRNTLRGHKLNHGTVAPNNNYACMVRTESGAGVQATGCGLKANSGSFKLLKDHSGAGTYDTDSSNFYSNVTLPVVEHGSGRRAASVRFVGSDGTYSNQVFVSSVTRSSTGVYVIAFNRAVPLDALLMVGGGTANGVVSEDESYGSRTVFQRQIKTHVAGTLTDLAHVSVTWRYA